MKNITILSSLFMLSTLLTACTYNVSLVHTEGSASDVIDTDQKADADVSAQIPVRPL